LGAEVKAKKKCCKSGPRCKRCPVVCKRLEAAGYLERESKRRWRTTAAPPKKALKAARA
jgi:hypothetical protein